VSDSTTARQLAWRFEDDQQVIEFIEMLNRRGEPQTMDEYKAMIFHLVDHHSWDPWPTKLTRLPGYWREILRRQAERLSSTKAVRPLPAAGKAGVPEAAPRSLDEMVQRAKRAPLRVKDGRLVYARGTHAGQPVSLWDLAVEAIERGFRGPEADEFLKAFRSHEWHWATYARDGEHGACDPLGADEVLSRVAWDVIMTAGDQQLLAELNEEDRARYRAEAAGA
jgi:hypothetical protein